MAEKTIPWWRKALEFALGGFRSRFGFFTRNATPEPVTEALISGSYNDHPEEEKALNEPSLQVVAASANPAIAAKPARAAIKGRKVSNKAEQQTVKVQEATEIEVGHETVPEPVKVTKPMTEAEPEAAAETAAAPEVEQAIPVAELPLEAEPEPAPEPVAIPVAAAVAGPRRLLKPQPSEEEKAAARKAARQKKLDEGSEESPFSVIVGQVYDGPMDLLLDLIRKQDIDIYDIPIATITSQFLAYVNQLRASDVDVAGDFIYTASLLIHIKSKMLLPHSDTGPEQAAEDPRRELVERLLEHERFKNAAQMLLEKQMLEAASWSNPGAREFKDDEAAEPEIAADTVDLVRIFRDILERARKRPAIDVTEDSVTVARMIQFLARRLAMEDKPVALRRLLSHTNSERALIAMFLALLELVRLQAVLLRQDRAFSEIFIKRHTGFETVMNEGLIN
ncbi:MAG: segregation and condensation protein A, partial [Terracidiphilus sp.]